MKVVLGIDTSSVDLGIGIFCNGEPVASYSRFVGNSHAEHIAPIVRMLLEVNRIPPDSVGHIAVATGPGSFTGLRIGIGFAKGYCTGSGAVLMPVSSLFILAHAALPVTGRVWAAIDARNGFVYTASFISSGESIDRETQDSLVSSTAFLEAVSSGDTIIADTAGYKKSDVFLSVPKGSRLVSAGVHFVNRGFVCASTGAAHVGISSAWFNSVDVHPNYLRQLTPETRSAGCSFAAGCVS